MAHITPGQNATSVASGTGANVEPTAATILLSTRVTGDTFDRFTIGADGKMSWGPGNGAVNQALVPQIGNGVALQNIANDLFDLALYGSTGPVGGGSGLGFVRYENRAGQVLDAGLPDLKFCTSGLNSHSINRDRVTIYNNNVTSKVPLTVGALTGLTADLIQAQVAGVSQMRVLAGGGLCVKEGPNAKQGTATLTAGSVVVANTSVTANSRILLTSQVDGGTPGFLRVSARTAGTSFTITSSSATDISTVAYQIFEPA